MFCGASERETQRLASLPVGSVGFQTRSKIGKRWRSRYHRRAQPWKFGASHFFQESSLKQQVGPPPCDLSPELWHRARLAYFQRAGLEPSGIWQEYNAQVDQCLNAIEAGWHASIAAELGVAAEQCPTPESLGLFQLTPADRISVVVPVFNEERTIVDVLDQLASVPPVTQIVVVNDASRDQTRDRLVEWQSTVAESSWRDRLPDGLIVLNHEVNQGKGAALRTGFARVTQPWTGIQDADTEYNPADLLRLLTVARTHSADMVYGSRFCLPETWNSPAWHRWGNRLITQLANLSFGTGFSDVETCYKLIRSSRLHAVSADLRENRFGIEIELTGRLAKLPGIQMAECPISYDRRTYAEGKKIGLKDAFRAVWCMARYR